MKLCTMPVLLACCRLLCFYATGSSRHSTPTAAPVKAPVVLANNLQIHLLQREIDRQNRGMARFICNGFNFSNNAAPRATRSHKRCCSQDCEDTMLVMSPEGYVQTRQTCNITAKGLRQSLGNCIFSPEPRPFARYTNGNLFVGSQSCKPTL